MNHAKRIGALICVIVICFTLAIAPSSYADALTINMISAASYAVASSYGINFGFSNPYSGVADQFMERQINDYLGDNTIAEVFGSEVIRVTAGKLIIPGTLFNAIKGFLDDYVTKNNLQIDSTLEVCSGYVEGMPIGVKIEPSQENYLYRTFYPSNPIPKSQYGGYWTFVNGEEVGKDTKGFQSSSNYVYNYDGFVINSINNAGQWDIKQYISKVYDNGTISTSTYGWYYSPVYQNKSGPISAGLAQGYGVPTVLNPSSEYYEGDLGLAPDTNLEQLLGHIFDGIENGDIVIDGEIVEPGPAPTPVPTPVPINPDTPLQDVPWEGLNDLLDQTAQGINEQIQSQTQSITSAQEATTEAVESLTDTITSALDVPDSEELPDFKFDLRELFPFCIPFDIYRLLSSFDADPVAPHVQLPIVIESIGFSYNLDLDFAVWNPVAQAMRTAELIVYAIALAWATGKVIKW